MALASLQFASRLARSMPGSRAFSAGASIGPYDNVLAEVYVDSARAYECPMPA